MTWEIKFRHARDWYYVWVDDPPLTPAQEQEANKRANDAAYETLHRAWLRTSSARKEDA
jgi:hypothetical protein